MYITVMSGQTVSGLTVGPRDFDDVSAGGTVDAAVLNGGFLSVQAGGVANGVSFSAGGYLSVSSGGTAENVSATGHVDVSAGGTLAGVAVGPGGTVLIYPGATVTDVAIGANQSVDFANVPYLTNATTSLDAATDLLTISHGAQSETIQLAGSFAGESIVASSDNAILTFGKGTPGTSIYIQPTTGAGVGGADGNTLTVNGGSRNDVYLTVGGLVTFDQGATGNEVVLGKDAATVDENGSDTVFGGSGPATVTVGSTSSSTIDVGGAGLLTVNAAASPGTETVFAGTGGLSFTGGSGQAIVVGGGNPTTIDGGRGGGQFYGGGSATIHTNDGAGVSSVLVGGNGDQLYASGNTGDLFGAESTGDLLMNGLGSSGNDVFFGAAGTGRLTFITGPGNDVLGLGQGTNVVNLGTGHSTVFANTGTTGVSSVVVGAGAADIALGGKAVAVTITAAAAPRDITLYNYVPGADTIALYGFAPIATAHALTSQQNTGGSTTLVLDDGSRVALIGTPHVDRGLFG